jgi:two-component system osmolarity sensor histidine kinase EnvZ
MKNNMFNFWKVFKYSGIAVFMAILYLLMMQGLLSKRIERQRINELVSVVFVQARLSSLALETLPSDGISQASGIELKVIDKPKVSSDLWLISQAEKFQLEFCKIEQQCPLVVASTEDNSVWVELPSPYEKVWMSVQVSPGSKLFMEPLVFLPSILGAAITTLLIFLSLEIDKPLKSLEAKLNSISLRGLSEWKSISIRGSKAVSRLTEQINKMGESLKNSEEDRTIMLAGMAHDLRAPITRLQMRLGQKLDENKASLVDLKSLSIILEQFLFFAGSGEVEKPIKVPLNDLISELKASTDADINLNLIELEACIRPVSISRAIRNLLENAIEYGDQPICIELKKGNKKNEFQIIVWDSGFGIEGKDWPQALKPFKRFDSARRGRGHCGLGLAISSRIANEHGGCLEPSYRSDKYGFGVVFSALSIEK